MIKTYVLDSSVFIYDFRISGTIYTVPAVIRELKSPDADMTLHIFQKEGLRIESPSEKEVKAVMEKAKSTGDYLKLSPADIDLLAKALEVGGTLVTDDYAVQNVAACLGIATQEILQTRIKRVLRWRRRCVGCGRVYNTEATTCPVCGSEVKLKPMKK